MARLTSRTTQILSVGLVALALTATSLRAADWRDYLKRPVSPGSIALLVEHSQDAPVLERWTVALRDRDPRVRAAAARMANVSNAVGVVPALLSALENEADAGAGTEEIRAIAALGGTATDLALVTTARRLGPWAVRAYAGMLARARGAEAVNLLDPLQLSVVDRQSVSRLATGADRETLPTSGQIVRSIGDLPAGLFPDVVQAAGCKFSKDRPLGGAEIVYDQVGRPKTVSLLKSDLSSACSQAVRALLFAALGPTTAPAGMPQVVVVVIAPEVIACLDARGSDVAGSAATLRMGRGDGGAIPTKIRDVQPIYPQGAQIDRTQGQVIGEGVIGPTGCMEALRVLRYSALPLAVASVQAVSGWQYTPTVLNGVPARVTMTWSTSFNLQ